MQNSIIKKISPKERISCLLILILCLLMAKSIFLILFISCLTLILFILSAQKVKSYVKVLKNLSILLFILIIIYIIIFEGSLLETFVSVYKFILISTLIIIFIFNTNFRELHEIMYYILIPLKWFNVDIQQLSLEIVLAFYFLVALRKQKMKLKSVQKIYNNRKISFKKIFGIIFVGAINELETFKKNLKVKFYKINCKSSTLFSKCILMLFLVLLILVVFKEVI